MNINWPLVAQLMPMFTWQRIGSFENAKRLITELDALGYAARAEMTNGAIRVAKGQKRP